MQQQVLLTRSSFLADKLRVYICKLIESLTSESPKQKISQGDDDSLGNLAVDSRPTISALNLSDDDFPLVCTFDDFLELLENTVRCDDKTRRVSSDDFMLANA